MACVEFQGLAAQNQCKLVCKDTLSSEVSFEEESQELEKRIQTMREAELRAAVSSMVFEEDLRLRQVPLQAIRKGNAALQKQCKDLHDKHMAMYEEMAEMSSNMQGSDDNLTQREAYFRNQLTHLSQAELMQKKVCSRLRDEEACLQSAASALEVEVREIDFSLTTCKRPSQRQGSRRWGPSADATTLEQAQQAERKAVDEAAIASATLAAARSDRAKALKEAKVKEVARCCAAEARLNCVATLQEEIANIVKTSSGSFRGIASWQSLQSSYMRAAEADGVTANGFDEQRFTANAKAITLSSQIEEATSQTLAKKRLLEHSRQHALGVAQCMRKVAMASPVLAAWLVCAWWLAVPGLAPRIV